ncbi:MAG TPA: hypothetical protein VG273_21780 [Bryobacteraceae bacterium]|jgi:hypothetical protein|nr:hypothetical protein [Bryobacteraceae bacterium]
MALSVLKEIRKIYSSVNAAEIRNQGRQDLHVGLMATDETGFQQLESFLAPASLPEQARNEALWKIHRITGTPADNGDFILCEPGVVLPPGGYTLDVTSPAAAIARVVADHEDKELTIASSFPAFRRTVADNLIHRVSGENALFSLFTALPNVVPSMLDLPWAVGEFASDTAFLTMNQIRMALMMAAAHNRVTGYKEQKMEIAAIAGGAFGWRALARELVGKIPLGGGLIPKAAVAFAGTYVVGLGLEKINRNGEGLSKWEKREAYAEALEKGRVVARTLATPFMKRP